MKRFLLLLFLLATLLVEAQDGVFGYYESAMMYSRESINGSGRTLGHGGAQNALGADMGSGAYNPAGIGLYRKSNVAISSTINVGNSFTEFNDAAFQTTKDSKENFNVNNFGFVWASPNDNPEDKRIKGLNFGISRTRLDNYHHQYSNL